MGLSKEELQSILELHSKWLNDEEGGARADLQDANLQHADLQDANLQDADLRGACIDYSCWPLWCGSKDVKVDARIAAQLAAHFCVLDCDDESYLAARSAILGFAQTSHRAGDLGLLEVPS